MTKFKPKCELNMKCKWCINVKGKNCVQKCALDYCINRIRVKGV